jgi:hypothetical protein
LESFPGLSSGCLVILGKRDWGKSFLASKLARFRPNGLAVDPMGDLRTGLPLTLQDLDLIERPGWFRINLPAAATAARVSTDQAAACCFRFVVSMAKAGRLPRPFCLLVDEADLFGGAAFNDSALREVARYGRHWGVTFLVTTRRYSEIPKDWTGQADVILAGRSVDPRDSDIVREIFGRSHMRTWEGLKKRRFLVKCLDSIGICWYDQEADEIKALVAEV